MSDQAQLLKMLEPSVRPAGTPAPKVQPKQSVDGSSFTQLLDQARGKQLSGVPAEPVKLSAHAQQRLEQRGLSLEGPHMTALAEATDRAAAKGGTDTLMLMDRMGLIVNVPNRTVVTVLDEGRMADGVVTQIDSAVLLTGGEAAAATDAEAGFTRRDDLNLV